MLIVNGNNRLVAYPKPFRAAIQGYLGDVAKLPLINNADLFIPVEFVSSPFIPDPLLPLPFTTLD